MRARRGEDVGGGRAGTADPPMAQENAKPVSRHHPMNVINSGQRDAGRQYG